MRRAKRRRHSLHPCLPQNVREIYEPGTAFELGRGQVLVPGTDVLLVGSGYLMADALDAAEELGRHGISVEVVDPVTVKPFDEELIWNEAQGKKLVVTYENHSVINGIGSAVADVLAKHGAGVPLLKLGAQDVFGQVGLVDLLKKNSSLPAQTPCRPLRPRLHKGPQKKGLGSSPGPSCRTGMWKGALTRPAPQ